MNSTIDKWGYVKKIRRYSTHHIDRLLDMMETYKKYNLQEITLQEAKEYYENLVEKKEKYL